MEISNKLSICFQVPQPHYSFLQRCHGLPANVRPDQSAKFPQRQELDEYVSSVQQSFQRADDGGVCGRVQICLCNLDRGSFPNSFKFTHACLPCITWVSTSCSFHRSATGQRVLWQSRHCAGGHQGRPRRLEGCSRQTGQRAGRPIRVRLGLLATLFVKHSVLSCNLMPVRWICTKIWSHSCVSNTWLVSRVKKNLILLS